MDILSCFLEHSSAILLKKEKDRMESEDRYTQDTSTTPTILKSKLTDL